MQNQTSNTAVIDTRGATGVNSGALQVATAFLLGTIIMFGVGFVNMDVVHNAAHDARHAFAFPCH